ncbi:Acg family FMN-binding oxidoreductase [Actinomycetospora cinnamomea]|uniref:Nitroreductase family protein n=1 Tax=Actinomycetospora cinnamomea TaxID=663609 RepID=A0A2U1F278_9PSEU|nr:nitroreductase family protein [Actinomycetospora cinnamomea]PVZ06281.1 nitroreductase family protein [Actinomycetospora cinnamomea]
MTVSRDPAAREAVLAALEGALRAPSEHNTQPWRWTLLPDRLELAVDPHRRLPFTDERGEGALLACGAALHHLRIGLAVRGWTPLVRLDREGPPQRRVAEVGWEPADTVPDDARRHAAAIERRRTDRRRFGADPVDPAVLDELARVARAFDGAVHVVAGRARRTVVEAMRDAALLQLERPGYAAELQRWTHRYVGGADGLPHGVRLSEPHLYDDLVLRWFPGGGLDQPHGGSDHEDASTLLVLSAHGHDTASVVRAGEAMSAVLLEVTAHDLAATPVTQVLEVDETRERVSEVAGGHPVVVLRVGRPVPEAPPPPRTPRRDLASVLIDRSAAPDEQAAR